MTVLVSGGAGYVGSHMVQLLVQQGTPVVVVDDFSDGYRDALPPEVPVLESDIGNASAVVAFLRKHRVDAVVHLASRIQAAESVVVPRLYYEDNLGAAIALVGAVLTCGVPHFILSSSAAVYGNPDRTPIPEDHTTNPINPHGETKLATERMLASYGRAYKLRWAALRYFNASGAAPDGSLDESHTPKALIPLVLDAAVSGKAVTVFGRDYPTRDGTCERDYVHVVDVARAHLAALDHLRSGGAGGVFNLGAGKGHTVDEVIGTCTRVTERDIAVVDGPRREGEPPVLVADISRAREVLGWEPERSDLATIVRDAWQWRRRSQSRLWESA
jgi:UDP-glucose 4-epimerase